MLAKKESSRTDSIFPTTVGINPLKTAGQQFTTVANIHFDKKLVSTLNRNNPRDNSQKIKDSIISKPASNTLASKSCSPHIQESAADSWAIICLSETYDPLTQQDKDNLEVFSQQAEIVTAKVYSNQAAKTKTHLTKLLNQQGIEELTTESTERVCANCLPYAVLRSLPFK